jgi:hypothetical protein
MDFKDLKYQSKFVIITGVFLFHIPKFRKKKKIGFILR